MKKAFIVSYGTYPEDYIILSIFDDIKLAKHFINTFDEEDKQGLTIEDYTINKDYRHFQSGQIGYEIIMNRSGRILSVNTKNLLTYAKFLNKESNVVYKDGNINFLIYAHSKEKAIEMANTKRLIILKQGVWGEDLK